MLLKSIEQSILSRRRARSVATVEAPSESVTLSEDYVIGTVLSQDRLHEQERLGVSDYSHVSSLIGMCPRQHALASDHDVPLFKKVTGGHRVMWILGRAVERHIRQQFIDGAPGVLYGEWHCVCEETSYTGYHDPHPPEWMRCSKCRRFATR